MPRKIRISDQARVNLLELWMFVAEDNVEAANSVYDRMSQTFRFLAENPNGGRMRDDLRPGVRSYPVGQYLVFYHLSDDSIIISRVLHGSRNLEALFEHEAYDTFRMTDVDLPS